MNKSQKKELEVLIQTAKYAIQEVMMFKHCTFEQAIANLEELEADISGFIDGFKDDIINRDEE